MSAGTIALTNNSTAVSGTGTSFTTELKVGDFIGVIAGGTPYTLIVASISSNTQLTIGGAFAGPTASGLAWNGVPASLLYAVTQQIMNDMGTALRGMNSQLVNWQRIYSDASSVTVERPDSTSFTGPSWGYMAQQYASKANTADVLAKADNLSGLADKATARSNLGVSYGTTAGTVAQGNDARLGTLNNKSGGNVSSLVNVKGDVLSQNLFGDNTQGRWSSEIRAVLDGWGRPNDAPAGVNGAYFGFATISPAAAGAPVQGQLTGSSYWQGTKRWYFPLDTGNAIAPGTWVSNSDERIKTKIQRIDDPIGKMRLIKGVTWERLDNAAPGIGFIAQDVQAVFPDSVFVSGDRTLKDGTVVKNILSPDTSGVAAALHHEAILALMDKVEEMENRDSEKDAIIAELQSRMKAIDGLDA